MEFRKASAEDSELLTENRMDFVTSIRALENPVEFRQATKEYFIEHLNDGSLISYICIDKGEIVSSCLLCIYNTIPIPSAINGKSGLLLNVYTLEKYRRQGIARALICKLIDIAREMNVSKIWLDFTDEGYALYKSLGFVKCDRNMELKL